MKPLLELAREYAKNNIDKDTYRKLRREFIHAIYSGELKIEPRKYLAPLVLPDKTGNNVVADRSQYLEEQYRNTPAIFNKSIIVLIAIACLCMVILIIALFTEINRNEPVKDIAIPPKWESLINDFIREKNWEQNNIKIFVTAWQSLSKQETDTASASPAMAKLTNAIYQRLLIEQALQNLDSPGNTGDKQRLLIELANSLQINDDRITTLEQTTRQ